MIKRSAALVLALLNVACSTLEPALPKAEPDIAAQWSVPETAADNQAATIAADVGWRDFLVDERLRTVVARALEHNRDLRVAVLNVERARNVHGIQQAGQLPAVGATVQSSRTGGGDASITRRYSAGVGVDFELDLFGRVRSLSEAALREYLATAEARRAAHLSLVAEVAGTYLTLAADRELLSLSRATLANFETSFDLAQKRFDLGAVSRVDVAQSRTLVESARADVARFEGQVARDTNALTLLVGATVDDTLLPAGFGATPSIDGSVRTVAGLPDVPAGLPSEVLLRRPDVLRAEQRLRAANANIGAARAAFFPSIRLTGSVGNASTELAELFSAGSAMWSFLPRIDLPIFQGGRLSAALGVAQADRDIALAQYEKSIQTGFREVGDAFALSATLARQAAAQQAQLAAATQAHDLARERYRSGRDSYLVLLDAQRTLYGAQQALVNTRLAEQVNRVTLYKALGGGWKERS